MRNVRRTISLVVLSMLVVPASSGVAAADAGLVTGWDHRTVSQPGPIRDRRHRKQDIAWLGYNRFATVWIHNGGIRRPGTSDDQEVQRHFELGIFQSRAATETRSTVHALTSAPDQHRSLCLCT